MINPKTNPLTNTTIFNSHKIEGIYEKRAGFYERFMKLYDLVGLHAEAYRRPAIEALGLKPGDTVVDIGCGTGLNFPIFQEYIGPEGKIIGVDMTDAMLNVARGHIEAEGWTNVTLHRGAAELFEIPEGVAGVFSSYALTLMPGYDVIIQHAADALRPDGRMVVLDFKLPPGWKARIAGPLEFFLVRPYGGTLEMARQRHPWEAMEREMKFVGMTEMWGGYVYYAVGEKVGALPVKIEAV